MKQGFLFGFFARIFVGGIYAYAGYAKLMEPHENFRGLLEEYTIFTYPLTEMIALALPWFEFIFGVFLIIGYAPRFSAVLLTCFSTGFLVVLGISKLVLGILPETCGCFGENGLQLSTNQVMILDAFNIFLGVKIFLQQKYPWSFDNRLI